MDAWYCMVGQKRYGPIPEPELRRWIAEGRVRLSDLVWTQGMAEWTAVSSMQAFFGPGVAGVAQGRTAVSPPGGTGGNRGISDLLSLAWHALEGRWGLAIGFALLLWLLQAGCGLVPYAGFLAGLLLTGPFTLGGAIFFLTFIRRGQAELGMLFAGFHNFGSALGAYLLMIAFALGWALLPALAGGIFGLVVGRMVSPDVGLATGLIVGAPGLVVVAVWVGLRYSQTFYLLADSPSLGAYGAISRSVQVMRGNKLRLLGLGLLFGLVGLVCLVILCIGWVFLLVFVMPFMGVAYACFHDDLYLPPGQSGLSA